MKPGSTIAAVLLLGAIMVPSDALAAMPLLPGDRLLAEGADGSMIELVQGGRCRMWRRECSVRWGFRTPRYFRCMARNRC
jgi:hypothetical protein